MALVVEDGTGRPDADSYVSLAYAEAYVAEKGLTWTGDDTAKEQALRRATAWIDARYTFPGRRREARNQALLWPRYEAYDVENEHIASDAVPVEIERATVEAAVREANAPGSLSPDVTTNKELTGLGELTWTLTGSGPDSKRPVLTVVDDILSRIVGRGGGSSMEFLRS